MKLLVVLNPVSGGVEKQNFLAEAQTLCAHYGIELHIFKTTGSDDEKRLKDAVAEFMPDRIASVGGDGTAIMVCVAMIDTDIPIGIVPMGSANGMAGELNVPDDPMGAFRDLITTQIILDMDLILVNNRHYCMHLGDVGINAQMIRSYQSNESRGMLSYANYFIEEVGRSEQFQFEIETAGEKTSHTGVMICICNGRKFGLGIPANLTGNPFDGKFEIVIIHDVNAQVLINAGLSKFDETFLEDIDSTQINATEATIRFPEPRLLQLDGESIGEFDELNVKTLPSAIKLLTHSGNPYSSPAAK